MIKQHSKYPVSRQRSKYPVSLQRVWIMGTAIQGKGICSIHIKISLHKLTIPQSRSQANLKICWLKVAWNSLGWSSEYDRPRAQYIACAVAAVPRRACSSKIKAHLWPTSNSQLFGPAQSSLTTPIFSLQVAKFKLRSESLLTFWFNFQVGIWLIVNFKSSLSCDSVVILLVGQCCLQCHQFNLWFKVSFQSLTLKLKPKTH